MTIKEFKESKEGEALLRIFKEYQDTADKWLPSVWKTKCTEYAVISCAIELFLDEDYNVLDIPETATGKSIWDSVCRFWRNDDYATEILGFGDNCWGAFESAFSNIDPNKED